MSKTVVMLITAVLLCLSLTACGGRESTVTPSLEAFPTSTHTHQPQTPPAVRSVPTLPPEWTKTFTPTFTITPTLTSTPTATALIPEANVCASFTFELEDLSPDILVSNDVGINFAAGVEQRDAIVTILTSNRTNPGGTAPDRSDIFGGQLYLVNFGEGIASGVYDWTASVSTSYYTDICKKNGTVTVVAPATPEPTTRPSLADELLGVIIRRIREDVFAPMQTQTQAGLLTATPAAP